MRGGSAAGCDGIGMIMVGAGTGGADGLSVIVTIQITLSAAIAAKITAAAVSGPVFEVRVTSVCVSLVMIRGSSS